MMATETKGRNEVGHGDHRGHFGAHLEMFFSLGAGAAVTVGWLFDRLVGEPEWTSILFYLCAYPFGSYFAIQESLEKFRKRKIAVDLLVVLAAVGAAILGAWGEGGLLLFLFSMGHALEHYAMGRAQRSIEALVKLVPQTALVMRGESTREVNIDELVVGDRVIVRPNERIPADGLVIDGVSSVNQAPITGESIPVDKMPARDIQGVISGKSPTQKANQVFAGSINGAGVLKVYVTRQSSESTLAHIVDAIRNAQAEQSPTQRFAERFEQKFVVFVFCLVLILLLTPLFIAESWGASFYRAMAVLVAATPCALAIATPSAVLSGIARAARGGVLIKGGGPLEILGRVDAIAFDKTGTLTEGQPRVTDVLAAPGTEERELLRIAVAVEQLSDHPLATAIVRDASARLGEAEIPKATDLQSLTGRGIQANVEGRRILIGKRILFAEKVDTSDSSFVIRTLADLESQGRTVVGVQMDDMDLGVIGLMDTPRATAKTAIAELRRIGIARMIMLSGDNQQVANSIASQVGLDEAIGDMMPEEKVTAIKRLRSENGIAMVGDGVNDGPALASASVGIAMGAAGSDVALESADIALMADDLSHLPFAVGLSRQATRIIQQNLWCGLAMVAILVPATIFGLRMGPTVILHEGSTLLVILNALRLLGYDNSRQGLLK